MTTKDYNRVCRVTIFVREKWKICSPFVKEPRPLLYNVLTDCGLIGLELRGTVCTGTMGCYSNVTMVRFRP